jgi:hypothetical protein
MALYDEDGNRIDKADFPAEPLPADPDPELRVTAQVFRSAPYPGPGETNPDGTLFELAYNPGDRIRQSQIDALYGAATVSSVAPAVGPAAGGTVVTVTGTNLTGVSKVTFGGTAGTNLTAVSGTQVKVTAPAHAAGAVDVVVSDDSGDVTKTGAFTYQ